MVTAVLTPFVITLMGLSLWVVRLLYSSEFTAVVPFVILAAAGTLLRGISWCMAFVILAKGDGRTYFVTEVSSSLLSIILNIVGFRLGGFLGLGIAYIVWYLCYTAGVGAVYRYRYHFTVSAAFLPYALYALFAAGLAAWLALTLNPYTALPIAFLAAAVSLRTLRRKLRR
jgi:O-antigen/teichoic acid export membrane protein